jgi:hypothetical protein
MASAVQPLHTKLTVRHKAVTSVTVGYSQVSTFLRRTLNISVAQHALATGNVQTDLRAVVQWNVGQIIGAL